MYIQPREFNIQHQRPQLLNLFEHIHAYGNGVNTCPAFSQLQSVTKSDFHLYVGSSNGRVIVYALGRVCLRPEKHRCHLHDEPQWFCEQVSRDMLVLGAPYSDAAGIE